jgi:tRNA-Thr(GGU) m(6)t(6)A37 methyltransferase TsaA
MENEESQIWLKPVGVVRNEIKGSELLAKPQEMGDLEEWHLDDRSWEKMLEEAKKIQDVVSELVINENLEDALDGVEAYSHLMVLYWAHFTPPEWRSLTKGYPMGRTEFPKVGIFATCSPVRPNPILLSVVQLLERKGNVLKVKGLDAIDGSLLLDIKPYVPSYYARTEVKMADWMVRIGEMFAEAMKDREKPLR